MLTTQSSVHHGGKEDAKSILFGLLFCVFGALLIVGLIMTTIFLGKLYEYHENPQIKLSQDFDAKYSERLISENIKVLQVGPLWGDAFDTAGALIKAYPEREISYWFQEPMYEVRAGNECLGGHFSKSLIIRFNEGVFEVIQDVDKTNHIQMYIDQNDAIMDCFFSRINGVKKRRKAISESWN
jgi:hypothetical protein